MFTLTLVLRFLQASQAIEVDCRRLTLGTDDASIDRLDSAGEIGAGASGRDGRSIDEVEMVCQKTHLFRVRASNTTAAHPICLTDPG